MATVTEHVDAPTRSDLEMVLDAWHEATERLRRTHETLHTEISRLTDELEIKNRELARKNRLADLGRMAAHVAHEVRNNLVPMSLYLSMLKRQTTNDQSASTLYKLEAGFTALEATVNDLLHFTASREPHWQRFDLRQLVGEIAESLAPQMESQSIRMEIDMPITVPVFADRNMMQRAILNVTLNSIDVMARGGRLLVTSWRGPDRIELEIADSGPGIDLDDPSRIFEPFFSTKQGGTGLGLSIVDHILTAHCGHTLACNCPDGGAAITMVLPRRIKEAAA